MTRCSCVCFSECGPGNLFPTPHHFVIAGSASDEAIPLVLFAMFRLLLPPNLSAAASRDAIAVRVEIDLAEPPAPAWFAALALLQRWSSASAPPKFIQLNRTKLRELVVALRGQPVFFWLNGPS